VTVPRVWVSGAVTVPRVWVSGAVTVPRVWVAGAVTVPRVWVSGAVTVPRVWVSGAVTVPAVSVTGAVTVPRVWVSGAVRVPRAWVSGAVPMDWTTVPAVWVTGAVTELASATGFAAVGSTWVVEATVCAMVAVVDEMLGANENGFSLVGVAGTSTAGAGAEGGSGAGGEFDWRLVGDTEKGEGLEGGGAGLDERWVAGAVGVAVDGEVGFGGVGVDVGVGVGVGVGRVVLADPVIVLAALVTSDVMADGAVLTPMAPARCDPNAKRRAKPTMTETRKVPSQQARRGPPNITFSAG
jgi:hypothetical protein